MKTVLLALLIFTILIYIPLNRRAPRYKLEIKLDRLIPLFPRTVWIYTFYYLFLPVSILLIWPTEFIIPFLTAQVIGTAVATTVWAVFPNGVRRPILTATNTPSLKLLDLIYHHDQDSNGLPSGHVLHTFISCHFLSLLYPQIWIILFAILLFISFSTITTKQHYLLDMITTLLISPLIIELSSIIHL